MNDSKLIVVEGRRPQAVALSEQDATMDAIHRMSVDPNVDTSKLEKLMAMRREIRAEQAEAAFNVAMNEAQAEMTRVATNAENPQTHSKYASYAALDRMVRPIYSKHGFALSFNTAPSQQDLHVKVLGIVSHTAGHTRTYEIDVPCDGKGAKGGDVMTLTHAMAAATSYGSRYLLRMIFNVAVGEGDTDGNLPEGPKITEKQVADLEALLSEVGGDKTKFLKYMKLESLAHIEAKHFDTVVKEIRAKQRRRPA